jgi:hypothetical protein
MTNAEFYHKYFTGKTLQEVYDLLPFAGYTRILCDSTGFYKPALHRERFGNDIVQKAFHYADEILWVEIGNVANRANLEWKRYKRKNKNPKR